ncbi:hypothetical protein EV201_1225 [Ancylomarina subtilis]|uniref:Uncharacterized protein n=1 Tax=Ancylomarina subtilis TaxID=1639035 RepID=A0A4Q7VKH9_9BACT|nr:hypothetical protein [Ancylomarina subtilis]RZT96587.1 hypothetical protein EV201_1225 [Ancylomarina subtilis]
MKIFLLRNYEYSVALAILFASIAYFLTPTAFVSSMGVGKGVIDDIRLEREYSSSVKSASRGYSDFYEIILKQDQVPYRCYSISEINYFGAKNLLEKNVSIQFNNKGEYKIIRDLKVGGRSIVKKNDRGFVPFLLLSCLFILAISWCIWGFYITYLVSDEKRKEILGK